jgi:hypothetical protein
MTDDREIKAGADFTEVTVNLGRAIFALCNETYKATKRPPAEPALRALIERAKEQIAEFDRLAALYTGGRRKSILSAGSQLGALRKYTAALEDELRKRQKSGPDK